MTTWLKPFEEYGKPIMPAREHESGGGACSEVETGTNFRLEGALPGSFLAVLSILKITIFVRLRNSWRGLLL
jgi:hypothetical protein